MPNVAVDAGTPASALPLPAAPTSTAVRGAPAAVPVAAEAASTATTPDAPAGPSPIASAQPWTSSATTYGVNGSVVSVDLYGFARVFDHVRLDYRADGTLATRTLLDTENPSAAIVIDHDEAGAAVARHELNLPDRPYARVDIVFAADGSVAERTRSGFATGDVASISVRFDPDGAITSVEHLQTDGSRTVVGTAAANAIAGHGGDLLVGGGGANTFVLVEGGVQPLAVADFHHAQGDRPDLSHFVSGGHFVGETGFDGAAGAVRFDHVAAGVLVSVEIDGDTSVLLAGTHAIAASDLIF